MAARALFSRSLASPDTRAFTALVDACRDQDEARRQAADADIARAFSLDDPTVPEAERVRRLARLREAARHFDRRYGRYNWGVRVAALVEGRF